ncbi:MAG: hypothetical protein HY720_30085 [Planctomycetes bacterium]|nr:hypothetical protein [Planctomycetota bacterium]
MDDTTPTPLEDQPWLWTDESWTREEADERPWAEIDEDWARKEARALAQREENEKAAALGLPLPYPNPWDKIDPTKLRPEDATPEAIHQSVVEFNRICRPRPRKRHVLSRTSPDSSPS